MTSASSASEALTRFFSLNYKTKLFIRKGFDEFRRKEIWHDYKRKRLIKAQSICVDWHHKYGSDVAVAQFILNYCLRGKVMLTDNPTRWLTQANDVPKKFNENIKLLKIDCSRSHIVPEGIDNLIGLEYLKSINLSGNDMLNDFACDQLARQFRASKSLEEIDLSHNQSIGISGVEVLFRIPSIKKIIIKNTWAAQYEHFELFSMLAEDERGCKIER